MFVAIVMVCPSPGYKRAGPLWIVGTPYTPLAVCLGMHVCYPGETCERHFICSCNEQEKSNRQLWETGLHLRGSPLQCRLVSETWSSAGTQPLRTGPLGGVAHKTPLQSSRSLSRLGVCLQCASHSRAPAPPRSERPSELPRKLAPRTFQDQGYDRSTGLRTPNSCCK